MRCISPEIGLSPDNATVSSEGIIGSAAKYQCHDGFLIVDTHSDDEIVISHFGECKYYENTNSVGWIGLLKRPCKRTYSLLILRAFDEFNLSEVFLVRSFFQWKWLWRRMTKPQSGVRT